MPRIVIAGLALIAWICLLFVARRLWARRNPDDIRPDERVPLRLKRGLVVIVLVALPASAAIVIWPFASCVGGGIDVGIARYGGECVGVTDGRYKFSGGFAEKDVGEETRRRLDSVENLIRKQNDIQGDFVKVAFLAPLTSPLSGPRAVDELEGAAAAQKLINKEGQGSPRIQLLIAHMGRAEKQWPPVVQQLIDMKDDETPLVAVVGLGLSQDETAQAAGELAKAGIPMVASSLTAPQLDPDNPIIKGFHQVSHNNEQQVDKMFQHLRGSGIDLSNGIVVQSDDESDSYSRSYAEAIAGRLRNEYGNASIRSFGDPNGDQGKLANQFRLISQTLCQDSNAVVFYAGRSRFISNFIQKLDDESCLDSALVLSGSDSAVLRMRSGDETAQQSWGVNALDEVLKKGKVSLLYTTQADPILLKDRPQFKELEGIFREAGFNANDLLTRWAIVSWDALRVMAQWVWRAQEAAQPELPRAEDVMRTSTQRYTDNGDPYPGASGDFWFDEKGSRAGDAPKVVRLLGDGSVRECLTQEQNVNSVSGGC